MGPEGGEDGGHVVATGTPEEIAAEPASHTGRFLAEILPVSASRNGARAGKAAPRKRRARVPA